MNDRWHRLLEARTTMKTFTIDEHSIKEIEKRVAAVNKKAAKRGAPLVSMKVLRTFTQRQQRDHASRAIFFRRAEIEIIGSNPVIRGYIFAARIRHEKAGNIIDVSPEIPGGDTSFEGFRESAPACQHCGMRRRRADTFLLLNVETRKLIQVGSSCLQDFLGTDDIGIALDVWGLLTTLADLERAAEKADRDSDESYGGGGRRFSGWKLPDFVAACLVDMRARGFVSRKMLEFTEGGFTTGEMADMRLESPHKFPDQPEPRDVEQAQQVIDYIVNLKATSTFEQNLVVLFKGGVVTSRDTGYAAAGVYVWSRAMEEFARKAVAKRTSLNEHVGRVGEKIQFRATVAFLKIVGHDSQYGPSTLMIWRDEQGRTLKWFASGVQPGGAVGDTYLVQGQVKSHGDREGQKETLLTRCKLGDDAVLQLADAPRGFVDQHGRSVLEDEHYEGPRPRFDKPYSWKVATSLDGKTVRLLRAGNWKEWQ